MHLIRLLVFFAAYHNFWFQAAHIAGKDNKIADELSRNNISYSLTGTPALMPALHSTSTSNHLGYPKPHMDVHQLDEAVRR